MFEYFPNNYAWSLSVAASLSIGGEMSEIDVACKPLSAFDGKVGRAAAEEAWFQNWSRLGDHLVDLATKDLDRGWKFSAGEKLMRACNYFLFAERNMSHADPRRAACYRKAHAVFGQGVAARGDKAERMTVSYKGKELAGWLHLPPGDGPHPCVIFLNGFDSIKEMHYLMYAKAAARRGIAMLFVDQEGTGEAQRFHHLPKTHETEISTGLFVDALEKHPAIDADRIGVAGISAGGYDAPRSAAFEKRLKCCVCVGALFAVDQDIQDMFLGQGKNVSEGLSNMAEHLMTVTGKSDIREAVAEFVKRDLTEVIAKVECPLLVIHGENDRQVPLHHAERTISGAVNAAEATLKVFTIGEGSCEHCGIDIKSMTADYAVDWIVAHLGGKVA